MKRIFLLLGSLLGLLGLLTGCRSGVTAVLSVKEAFVSDMERQTESDQPAQPAAERYEVRSGDRIGDAITVRRVTEQSVELRMDRKYISTRDYRSSTTFTVARGETLLLAEDGLYDASHTFTITYEE